MEEFVSLVRSAQKGDAEAYSRLVSRFQDMAYGFAYAFLGDFYLAEDAAQEAFIEAYRCLPELKEPLGFPAWLKRILFKHCDRLTRRKTLELVPLDAQPAIASSMPTPAEIAERQETAGRVQAAIQGLPVNQRVVTTLFYIDGYSQQEISAFLEVPVKTVKSRLHTSRQRLKERMMDMVQEELQANSLPEGFTMDTVEQAVAQARALIGEHQYDQAENLLQAVLARLPEHPAALKELNRLVMHGRVYDQGRWDLLPTLASQARLILQAGDDEEVCRELARTLLAIPAMVEAVDFLQEWIAQKGPSLERLGMLAWARGCLGEYETAERQWQEITPLAHSQSANEVLAHVPFIAYTLVDCFAAAAKVTGIGETERAQRVAQQAWGLCGEMGPSVPFILGFPSDGGWLMIYHQAGLDLHEIAPRLLDRHSQDDPVEQGMRLYLRAWLDDPVQMQADWLEWVKARCAAGEWNLLGQYRVVSWALRGRGLWDEANRLVQATWELLGEYKTEGAEQARVPWDWDRFNPVGFIQAKDWEKAEAISRLERQECGLRQGGPLAIVIAAGSGSPTPPELVKSVEEHGIDSVDEYGLFGWYLVAREAAFAGDAGKAFAALEKSLSYWANSPYFYVDIFEGDPCWDGLRGQAEFKLLFAEKRRQIGPIYGMLHYFPGW
jgi:RNA polymerase sigma factor (sigma-70 family)